MCTAFIMEGKCTFLNIRTRPCLKKKKKSLVSHDLIFEKCYACIFMLCISWLQDTIIQTKLMPFYSETAFNSFLPN